MEPCEIMSLVLRFALWPPDASSSFLWQCNSYTICAPGSSSQWRCGQNSFSCSKECCRVCYCPFLYLLVIFISVFFFLFFLRITWEDKYLKFLILILRGVFWKITDQIIARGVSLQILFVKWCFAILDSCFWSFQNGWPSCTCRGCLQLFLISIALEDFCFIAFLDESTLNHIGSITLGMIWLAWWSEVKGPSV